MSCKFALSFQILEIYNECKRDGCFKQGRSVEDMRVYSKISTLLTSSDGFIYSCSFQNRDSFYNWMALRVSWNNSFDWLKKAGQD